jgi:hypothetical protein
LEPKSLEVPAIGSGEVGYPVVPKGQGEAGVDDVAEAGGGSGGPVPERFAYLRLVVSEFPGGIGPQGVAEGSGFWSRFRPFEDCRIAQLHVGLQQDKAAEEETLSVDFHSMKVKRSGVS